jgi:hypothetical protein
VKACLSGGGISPSGGRKGGMGHCRGRDRHPSGDWRDPLLTVFGGGWSGIAPWGDDGGRECPARKSKRHAGPRGSGSGRRGACLCTAWRNAGAVTGLEQRNALARRLLPLSFYSTITSKSLTGCAESRNKLLFNVERGTFSNR